MSFGLINAPASLQSRVNDIEKESLNQGVVFYMDDILIDSKNLT